MALSDTERERYQRQMIFPELGEEGQRRLLEAGKTQRASAAIGHPTGELIGHTLSDERGVELGLLDLLDVELDLVVPGDLGEPGTEAVGLGAATADHDARTGGVDVDAEFVAGALDLDEAALETVCDVGEGLGHLTSPP